MRPTTIATFLLLIISAVFLPLQAQKVLNEISGIVTDGQSPLSNVTITIKGTEKGTATDSKGKYVIKANPMDVLIYSYISMKPVEIVVEDVTRILNISLWPKIEELDEVVVTKSKRKTQKDLKIEYATNKNIIKSNFGFIDKETTPFNLRTIEGDQLNPAALDLGSAISGKFAGVGGGVWYNGRGNQRDLVIYARGKPLVYEVDGMFMRRIPEIDIATIDRIGVIVGSIAGRRYGENVGGVMIINTKMAKYGVAENDGQPYDCAKLRNNIFDKNTITAYGALKSEPQYLQDLHKTANFEEAKTLYKTQSKKYVSSYSYALDAFRFFNAKHKKYDFSDSVVTDNWALFESNPAALKALAYLYQEIGDHKKANQLYKEIFIQRPSYGQSYLDLSNSYREIEDYKKAMSLYVRYNHLVNEGLLRKDTTIFSGIIQREYNNLITIKGNELLESQDLKFYVTEEEFQGTRLVFEWNDGEAEFELQFVNPNGNYFKTEHSLETELNRIQNEKLIGYSCEEFLIDNSLPGTWQINAKYLGNRKLTASYLKATIYYNYELETQRKETKVFKLGLKNVNQKLFSLHMNEVALSE